MTVGAQFCCKPAAWKRFRASGTSQESGKETGQELVMAVVMRGPGHGCDHAGGALRETTQSRKHDPTAQPQR